VRQLRRAVYSLAGAALILAGVFLIAQRWGDDSADTDQAALQHSQFVGAQTCAACHQNEFDLWRGSHHDLAMQHANDQTVLGDFGDQRLEYFGVVSTFTKDNDTFAVRTDGPGGELQNFEVKYTFGVEPLQQYLVELDGGRLQALHLAWDTRPKEQGGQRWFHLYQDEEIDHTDELHWTRLAQNWNHMCAECHSTNLKKNFDLEANEFKTTWSEINVACEACHGPGSQHVAWANEESGWKKLKDKGFDVVFDERHGVSWRIDDSAPTAKRSERRETAKEIETCARCHSRRSLLSENYQHGKSLMDTANR
jgi:mono/diheme cytochrome c family protein